MVNPNPYTGAFGNDGAKYAEDVRDVIQTCTPGGVAGFIAETIQGVGGAVPLADGYLPAVYQVCLLSCCRRCSAAGAPSVTSFTVVTGEERSPLEYCVFFSD